LSEERVERRLAAILAADVAGYSRLIEASEEGTLGRLKALRAEIIDPKIASHKGRIVKTTGDGLLVEFASVVDALRSAAEMQAVLAESNAPIPPERRIQFRIGISSGPHAEHDPDPGGDDHRDEGGNHDPAVPPQHGFENARLRDGQRRLCSCRQGRPNFRLYSPKVWSIPSWFQAMYASELCRPFKSNLIAPMLLAKPEAFSAS
jgi:hypothetical protein